MKSNLVRVDFRKNDKSEKAHSNRKELKEVEMKRLKTDYVRTSMKKSIRTYTHKLLKKADRNIAAVGKREFGLGVYK